MSNQIKTSFVKNAAILSFAGLFARLMGALYRIPLYRLIGDEGNGLYSSGYNIYAMLLAISATGIPVAISKLVSEELSKNRMGEARRIFKVALILLSGIGLTVTIGLMVFAPLIANMIGDPRTVYPLLAVAPAIILVAIMASFRGYFQGMQLMWPTAISQVLEQVGRVITVLALVWYLFIHNAPVEQMAAGASFGATAGSLIGLLVILYIYRRYRPYIAGLLAQSGEVSDRTTGQLIKRILIFAVPITIGAMVIPLMNGIDVALVPRRLQSIGYTTAQATALYGRLTAVVPLINLPSMLAYALSASLVPAISTASAAGHWLEVKSRSKLAIKLILTIGLPAAIGLSFLAVPITVLLYADVNLAAVLVVLAFAVIFLTLHQVCTGILQGLGKTHLPVRNLFIGGLIKITLNYTLVAIPALNIQGAAISSVIAYGVASFLNVRSVCKYADVKFGFFNMVVRPLMATGIMAVCVGGSYQLMAYLGYSITMQAFVPVVIGVASYALGILITKSFSETELKSIPYLGDPIIRVSRRLNWLRSERDE